MNRLRSLLRLFGSLRRVLPVRPSADVAWCAFLAAGLIGIEVFARHSSTDFEDAAAVLVLTLLLGAGWHRFGPRLRRAAVGDGVAARFARFRLRVGLDLRGTPPVERRWPRAYVVLLSSLVAAAGLVALTAGAWPGRALDVIRSVSGLAAIVALSCLWGVLAFGALAGLAAPFAALEARFQLFDDRRYEVARLWFVVGYVGLLVALALLLPTWVPFAVVAVAWVVNAAIILPPCRPMLSFLWRYEQAEELETATLPGYAWMIGEALLLGGTFALASVLSLGERLSGASPQGTAITGFLGHAFAWTVGIAYGMYYLDAAYQAFCARRGNPSRSFRPRVQVDGIESRDERTRVHQTLEAAGFDVVKSAPSGHAARIVLDHTSVPDEWAFPTPWPRTIRPDALEDPELHRDLRRRCDILARRRLRRGLHRLFKIGARREYETGNGFWVGPHLWFVTHLSRDSNDPSERAQAIGPPYHRALDRDARHHLYVVLAALEIDLIFVEDGVGFRRFQRVLAMLFEHYDIFAGTRPLEERHFTGLPGVRVVIHAFELDEPFRSDRYPEPDYEDIARARILHVFRDRGEDESVVDDPRESDWVPGPPIPQFLGF